jgi:hypothetical protein
MFASRMTRPDSSYCWRRKARDNSFANAVGGPHEIDRYRNPDFRAQPQHRACAIDEHDIRFHADKLCRVDLDAVLIAGAPTFVDADVASCGPPDALKLLLERRNTRPSLCVVGTNLMRRDLTDRIRDAKTGEKRE